MKIFGGAASIGTRNNRLYFESDPFSAGSFYRLFKIIIIIIIIIILTLVKRGWEKIKKSRKRFEVEN